MIKLISFKQPKYKHTNKSVLFYNSKGWRLLRASYFSLHPLCECCLEKGIVTQANEVHHKIPFLSGKTDNDKWRLLTNQNNLQSLCYKCHDEIHRNIK